MFEQIMYIVFFVSLAAVVLTSLFYFVQAMVADVADVRQQAGRKLTKKQLGARPIIDILIYSHNNCDKVIDTLQSIFGQSYRNYNIVIVDNRSDREHLRLVREFIALHPAKSVRVVAQIKHLSRAASLRKISRKQAAASWRLVVDAGIRLDTKTLHNANQYFIRHPDASAVAPNIITEHNESLTGLLQQVYEKSQYYYRKASRSSFKRAIFYNFEGTDVVGFDETVTLRSAPLPYTAWASGRTLQQRLVLLQAVAVAYMGYIAVQYEIYDYLLVAFLASSTLMILNVWGDGSQKIMSRFSATILGLPLYVVYVIDGVATTLLAPLYVLRNRNQVQ